MKKVLILIDYFGEWPGWFPVFLESCAANPTIDWCIHTDCEEPDHPPANVRFIRTSFEDFCARAGERLGVNFAPRSPYNLCNLRPMSGVIHQELIANYDYFGWGDIDVIYGDIRSIYTDEVFSKNVISSHDSICSGHLTLVKNEAWLREAYLQLTSWRGRLEDDGHFEWHECLDEAHLAAIFSPNPKLRRDIGMRCLTAEPDPLYWSNNHFVEQWSTPFLPCPWIDGEMRHPETWFWTNGVLTNVQDGSRTFLYLHLMNFKSKRWVNELYSASTTWDELPFICHFDPAEFRRRPADERRLRIDRTGIHLM